MASAAPARDASAPPAPEPTEGKSAERLARERLYAAVFAYASSRDEAEERARWKGAGAPPPTEGNGDMPPALRKLFDAVIEYVIERDEAEERARQAPPKAEIIPFPKARH